ncbi:hypothetical protein QFX71_000688 [Citrobacter amalonaticus]|uniref:hypothetical protein n=1 Tax=Citrobacter amalonaticus TaxID=35703 RepID=UPI0025A8D5BB|nr:hypothetical protein [Citrobacter amalonaticus]EKY5001816.1 hypothetical protein [Citrobacter amalonaticus]
MASFATEQKSYTDLVVYHADPVMAKRTISGLSLAADLNIGDVIDASGNLFVANDSAAYVVAVPASAGDTYVIVIGSGCVLNPAAINVTDPTGYTGAINFITAAGNRIADANTVITE